MYKKRSIGWRGEALSSLVKSSTVTLTTKHEDEPTGLKVTFSSQGDIKSLEPIELDTPGTLIEVRDIHKNNIRYQQRYKQNIKF
jgi:DNA mismatch repair ATPase MutL